MKRTTCRNSSASYTNDMWNLSNKKNKSDAKDIVLKELFNASTQKKAITRAARESAEDQRMLVERYNEMLRQQAVSQ